MICLQGNSPGKMENQPRLEIPTRERCCHRGFVFISTLQLNKYFRERVKGDFTAIN